MPLALEMPFLGTQQLLRVPQRAENEGATHEPKNARGVPLALCAAARGRNGTLCSDHLQFPALSALPVLAAISRSNNPSSFAAKHRDAPLVAERAELSLGVDAIVWTEQAEFLGPDTPDAMFGTSVAMSGNAVAIVGTPYDTVGGEAYVHVRSGAI
jgi:hypothetical protein